MMVNYTIHYYLIIVRFKRFNLAYYYRIVYLIFRFAYSTRINPTQNLVGPRVNITTVFFSRSVFHSHISYLFGG